MGTPAHLQARVESKMYSTDVTKREALRFLNAIGPLDLTVCVQKIQRTEEPIRRHHGDAICKIHKRRAHHIHDLDSSTSKLQDKRNVGGRRSVDKKILKHMSIIHKVLTLSGFWLQ